MRTKLSAIAAFLLLAAIIAGCPSKEQSVGTAVPSKEQLGKIEFYCENVDFDGERREYCFHVPGSYDGKKDVPLVILLHGVGGDAKTADQTFNMSLVADREGFVVVYPGGAGREGGRASAWNSGNCCGYALEKNVDDVRFITALIARMESIIRVDKKRIYVGGISNGGMMSYALGCELSDQIAAIASISGALNYENCTPKGPISALILHGTADESVLYEGGAPKRTIEGGQRVDKPVSYAVSFWASHDNCTSKRTETNGNVTIESYGECKGGTEVELLTVTGGGHALAGELPTFEILWDFFSKHPKQ